MAKKSVGFSEKQKVEIGKRLRKWCEENFDSLQEAAKSLQMSPQSLNSNYLSGRSVPGPSILNLIDELGGDSRYIITGDSSEVTAEELRMLQLLRIHQVKNSDNLQKILKLNDEAGNFIKILSQSDKVNS